MIRAGSIEEIYSPDGLWAYLDIGFARGPTSGLIIGKESAKTISFSDASQALCALPGRTEEKVNLVVEAPLSVSFDAAGNPTGRSVERYRGQTRYWYVGAGAVVTLAAMNLMSALNAAFRNHELVLYEGFVSFKKRNSSHEGDAALLQNTVMNAENYPDRLVSPDKLRMRGTDQLKGAFEIQGINTGIPPVIAVFG